MPHSIVQTDIGVSGIARKVHCFFNPNDRIYFEDGYVHYLHEAALSNIDRLDIHGLKNAEVYFLGQLVGNRTYWEANTDDSGVLNIVDCENVVIANGDIVNTRKFKSGNLTLETSNVINISRSRNVILNRVQATGAGKSVIGIHSGSDVVVDDLIVNGFYFEFNIAASALRGKNIVLNQNNTVNPDSHSAIWVSSAARHGQTGILYEETDVNLSDITFNMKTGRSLISGNGPADVQSLIKLARMWFGPDRDPTFGVATWHSNFRSMIIETDLDYEQVDEDGIPLIKDYVSTPDTGFARFVNYYSEPPQDIEPGPGPDGNAPIVVDGLSSANVF